MIRFVIVIGIAILLGVGLSHCVAHIQHQGMEMRTDNVRLVDGE